MLLERVALPRLEWCKAKCTDHQDTSCITLHKCYSTSEQSQVFCSNLNETAEKEGTLLRWACALWKVLSFDFSRATVTVVIDRCTCLLCNVTTSAFLVASRDEKFVNTGSLHLPLNFCLFLVATFTCVQCSLHSKHIPQEVAASYLVVLLSTSLWYIQLVALEHSCSVACT